MSNFDKLDIKPLRGQPGFEEPLTFPQQVFKQLDELKERIKVLEQEVKELKAKR